MATRYWYLIFVVLLSCLALSCSPSKKLQKAEDRVLANRDALDRVGREWEKLHPCANDTIFKTDSITDLQFVEVGCDSLNRPYIVDSLKRVVSDSLKGVIKFSGKTVAIPSKTITKTVTNTVVDRRREDLLTKDLNECRGQVVGQKQVIEQLTATIATNDKNARKELWKWRLILGIPLLLIILAFIFKKRIPLLNKI